MAARPNFTIGGWLKTQVHSPRHDRVPPSQACPLLSSRERIGNRGNSHNA